VARGNATNAEMGLTRGVRPRAAVTGFVSELPVAVVAKGIPRTHGRHGEAVPVTGGEPIDTATLAWYRDHAWRGLGATMPVVVLFTSCP
jgi:hypothetical protein